MEKKITVIIPAHNEEKTIRKVVKILKNHPLVDEILVINNASTDKTEELAKKEGAKVLNCTTKGKGYAMEMGIQEASNEVLIFLDGDITKYDSDIVRDLSEPIIDRDIDFVKSRFDRTGGRVTELVAKPLLEITFPNIQKFAQPLSGAIAGKKSLLKQIVLEKDYGVDIGILLDMIALNAKIEEVHIGRIKNDSQDWKALVQMSKEVQQAILKRAYK